ncbi:MAG: hypothetical protein ACWA5Q_05600 [bacterium]
MQKSLTVALFALVFAAPLANASDTATNSVQPTSGAMDAVKNLRKHRSQDQFERTIKRHYPKGYETLLTLSADDRFAVYEGYMRGLRMDQVRVSIYSLAAKQQDERIASK